MAAPLVASGLTKRYGGVRAVDGLALTVAQGAVVGIVGPNGCGKTTTLLVATGLVRADGGTVAVAGAPAGSLAARQVTGYVPDDPRGIDDLTVREYLALVRALWRADGAYDRRAAALLDAFALSARTRSTLGSLSRGMQRSVSIVSAAALAPALLVVDEATAALDPEAVIALRETVEALAARGTGVLLATQDLGFAERVCDEVVLMSAGRTVAAGTVADVLGSTGAGSLEEAFVSAVGRSDRRRSLDAVFAAR